jgi:hypothetical protein
MNPTPITTVAAYNQYQDMITNEVVKEVSVRPIAQIIVSYMNDDETFERINFFANKIQVLPWIRLFFSSSAITFQLIADRLWARKILLECEVDALNKWDLRFNDATVLRSDTSEVAHNYAMTTLENNPDYFQFCILSVREIQHSEFDKEKFKKYNVTQEKFRSHCDKLTFEDIQIIKSITPKLPS